MKNGKRTKVESLKHKDKRTNIPTEELRDFVAEDERKPKTVVLPGLLYARNPSLDPQLVWKGKDEQDQHALEVPAVPIYIQEKIHPHALIENLLSEAKRVDPSESLSLFSDFNGIKFEDLVDFYTHKEGVNWSSRLILGDSLYVMTSLAEKEGMKGKVQMIYMDPPYGIKFGSNWQVSTRKRDVKDGKVEDATRQPEQIRAFRDTWKLGIHSYLAYVRDRLVVARDLLTETGSVFVQIGDENLHLVRNLMDEVFGSENMCSLITVKKTGGLGSGLLTGVADYIVWYAKNKEVVKYRQIFFEKMPGVGRTTGARYDQVESADGKIRRALNKEERVNPEMVLPNWRTYQLDNLVSSGYTTTCIFDYEFYGIRYTPGGQRSWKTNLSGMNKLATAGRLVGTGGSLRYLRYLDDFAAYELTNVWDDVAVGTDKIYIVQTPTSVVQRCLLMTTDPGDLVLDPTCGSGTTAYVAEQCGRRWITTDTSRVALALARTRLMAATFTYYLLADSAEGIQKEAQITGQIPPSVSKTESNIKKGFVSKRVPHITLKSIANNSDIKEGMSREEIDRAIASHAETEQLFDQPCEDPKRIRVTGPFTVESLSPHRVLSSDDEQPASERDPQKAAGPAQFETMILENLRKAGVQNTVKNERLKFERLAGCGKKLRVS
jgi:adenine-specific DNA-methyltransferase